MMQTSLLAVLYGLELITAMHYSSEYPNWFQHVQNSIVHVIFDIGIRKRHDDSHTSMNLLITVTGYQLKVRSSSSTSSIVLRVITLECPAPSCLVFNQTYIPILTLHSFHQDQVTDPTSWIKFSSKIFLASAPQVWNELLTMVGTAGSVNIFKSNLKTYLYCLNFHWLWTIVWVSTPHGLHRTLYIYIYKHYIT